MRRTILLAFSLVTTAVFLGIPTAGAQTTVDGYARQGWTIAAVANNPVGDGSGVWLQKPGQGVVVCFVKHYDTGSHSVGCQQVR